MEREWTVCIDAMGGDFAPGEIVKGAVLAVQETKANIILVGIEDIVQQELAGYHVPEGRISIVHAAEVIGTDEAPTTAIRRKKDSSMLVGLNLVKEGHADAFVSAGSTGALLTGATVIVGRIKGIERPALGTLLPSLSGFTFLLDSGANVDCKPQYLEQFAKMASVYSEFVLGVEKPRIALANIGAEKEKGNALVKEAYGLLEQTDLHFIGNIEPREIPFGGTDVVVCDGFVGNTILKLSEGLSLALLKMIKAEITRGPYKIAAAMLKKPFSDLKMRLDADEVGGAPFLGLKSLVVKAHGSSKAKAVKNAVKQCILFSEADITAKIQERI